MNTLRTLFAAVAVVICMASCSKDDDPEIPLKVMANVTFDGTSASPSIVKLYDYDSAKDFDRTKDGANNFGDTRDLLDNNGNVIKPAYSSPSTTGVNTFEDVKPGKYIAIALYKPSGFSWPMFYYYGYATIDVSASTSPVMQWFKFEHTDERGEFIQF